jgi:hypothetical protein
LESDPKAFLLGQFTLMWNKIHDFSDSRRDDTVENIPMERKFFEGRFLSLFKGVLRSAHGESR